MSKTGTFKAVGSNIGVRMDGDMLILAINTKQRLGESGSGKSVLVASTHGNTKIATPNGQISLGLNLYVPKDGVKVGREAKLPSRYTFNQEEGDDE